jgi:nicotinamide riboside kinase
MEITPLKRCVCVIGPQSTGKTTLVNALADRFGGNVPVIREVARTVMEEKGYTRQDVDSANEERKFALQRDIFIAQIKMENEGLKSDSPFLSDRSAIDPLVYLTHYGGSDSAQPLLSTEEWKRARDRYSTKCLIILLSPVLPFLVDDDIRYVSKSLDDWYSLADSFREFVRLHNIPVMELGEECIELQERVSAVLIKLAAAEEVVEGEDGKLLCGFGG